VTAQLTFEVWQSKKRNHAYQA